MQDDDSVFRVEIGHQRVQHGVAEVLAVAVGGQLHAIGPQNLQGVFRFSQGSVHIGQRQGCTKHETVGVTCFQCSTFLVEPATNRSRSLGIAKIRLRSGHGQYRGLDASRVHEGKVFLNIPCRDGKAFVHLGTVGLDIINVILGDGVAVEVDLGRST